ncbi:MAG: deoxyribonuclease IV [Phycisphaerales bacterium]
MFGSHLSIAGSMANALREAETLGLECVQVFTKNQQQWSAPPLKADTIREWAETIARLKWAGDDRRVVSHASYLINMASPDAALRAKSIDLMREEIDRCEALAIRLLVFHPGAFTTSTLEEGVSRIADACASLLHATKGYRTVLCLENVAGAGSTIGRTFEELADLRSRIASAAPGHAARIGFCIDTCHAHAAGYDLSTPASATAALAALDRAAGLANVRVLHLNDSKGKSGSHLDRHEHIAKGTIGRAGFAAFVQHAGLAGLPKIMETPKGDDANGKPWDLANVALLRRLARAAPVPVARRRPSPTRAA